MADGGMTPHSAIEEKLLVLAGGDDLFGDRSARLREGYRRRAAAAAYRVRK
jgi:hypothetical protein